MRLSIQTLNMENIKFITSWFEDSEVEKYVGGKEWILNALSRPALAKGKEFRGAKVLDRGGYVVFDNNKPVGYVEAEIYDKHTLLDDKSGVVKFSEDLVTASFVYLVNPQLKGLGYGTEILRNIISSMEFREIKVFTASTDIGNIASEKSLTKAGFKMINQSPNFEDVYICEYKRD